MGRVGGLVQIADHACSLRAWVRIRGDGPREAGCKPRVGSGRQPISSLAEAGHAGQGRRVVVSRPGGPLIGRVMRHARGCAGCLGLGKVLVVGVKESDTGVTFGLTRWGLPAEFVREAPTARNSSTPKRA